MQQKCFALVLIMTRHYWLMMIAADETLLTQRQTKGSSSNCHTVVNIWTKRPVKLLCMNFLSLKLDRHNTKGVLVINVSGTLCIS